MSAEEKIQLESNLRAILVSPTEEEIDSLSHDLSDLSDLARRHQERVAQLLDMRIPNPALVDELLSELLYDDIVELEYHVESLKKILPNILKRLDPAS